MTRNLCDTCDKEFATCDPVAYREFGGEHNDEVLKCEAHSGLDSYNFSLILKDELDFNFFVKQDFISEMYCSRYSNEDPRVYFNINNMQLFNEYLQNNYNWEK